MIRPVLSLSIVAVFALAAFSAYGQESVPVSRTEFLKAIEELKEQIKSLKAPAVPAPPAPPAAVGTTGEKAASAVAAASQAEADLSNRVAELEKQVARLQREKEALTDIAANHSKMLGDIASDRETPGGGKHFVPNVQAIRDDHDARRALVDTVVHDMVRNSGELRIRNDMSTGQSLVVNGTTTVYVPAHAVQVVTVPSGTATTELAGETTKSWMIGAPNYSQEVIIAPAARKAPPGNTIRWQMSGGEICNRTDQLPTFLVTQSCQAVCSSARSRMP